MTPPAPRYYTAPGVDGVRTIDQIATMAGCGSANARLRIRGGKAVAGHVWTPEPGNEHTPARGGRVLLVADGDPEPRTYADLQKLGGFKHPKTAYIYVSEGTPICGRVYRRQGEEPTTRGQGGGRPPGNWRKDRHAEPAAPAPEGRRWIYGSDPEAADVFPRLETRLPAADGPQGVTA